MTYALMGGRIALATRLNAVYAVFCSFSAGSVSSSNSCSSPVAAVFAQGLTDDLLYKLTSRDNETSKQMFQLIIDRLPDTP